MFKVLKGWDHSCEDNSASTLMRSLGFITYSTAGAEHYMSSRGEKNLHFNSFVFVVEHAAQKHEKYTAA